MKSKITWLVSLAAGAAVAVIAASGVVRQPTAALEGGPIGGPATRPVEHLRLASFNVHSCYSEQGVYDPAKTAQVLRGFDLVQLNECRGSGPWWTGNCQTIGKLLGMHSLYLPVETFFGRPWFGNGVLSNAPITDWQTVPLRSSPGMAYRQLVKMDLPFGHGTLHLLTGHLGKKEDHAAQLKNAIDLFLAMPTPAVWMGDLNTYPNDPQLRQLLARGDVVDIVRQHMTKERADRVDYVLLRGVRCTDAGLVENNASDHPMVWAEIAADDVPTEAAPIAVAHTMP